MLNAFALILGSLCLGLAAPADQQMGPFSEGQGVRVLLNKIRETRASINRPAHQQDAPLTWKEGRRVMPAAAGPPRAEKLQLDAMQQPVQVVPAPERQTYPQNYQLIYSGYYVSNGQRLYPVYFFYSYTSS